MKIQGSQPVPALPESKRPEPRIAAEAEAPDRAELSKIAGAQGASPERLAELKRLYETGAYKVPAEEVAHSLLREHETGSETVKE